MGRKAAILAFAWLLLPAPAAAQAGDAPEAEAEPDASSLLAESALRFDLGADLARVSAAWGPLSGLTGIVAVRSGFGSSAGDPGYRVVAMEGEDVTLHGLPIGSVALLFWTVKEGEPSRAIVDVRTPLAARVHADLTLDLDLNPVTGEVVWSGGAVAGQVTVEGVDLEALTAVFPRLAVRGRADLEMTVGGAPSNPELRGSVSGHDVVWRGEAVGDVAVRWHHAQRSSTVDARWGPDGAPIASLAAQVPLAIDLTGPTVTWLDSHPHEVSLKADKLDPAVVRPFWKAPRAADFEVGVQVSGEGTLDRFELTGALRGSLKDPGRPPLPVQGDLRVQADRQSLVFELGQGLVRLATEARVDVVAVRRKGARLEPAALSGALDLDVPLQALAPYLPRSVHDPRGRVTGHVDVGGVLGAPQLDGALRSEGGAVTLLNLNQRLDPVHLEATVRGNTLLVDRLTATAGTGALRAEGSVELQATPPGQPADAGLWTAWHLRGLFGAELEHFPFVQDMLPLGLIDAQARVAIEAGPGDTKVEVSVAQGEVTLGEEQLRARQALPVNRSVQLLDWLGDVKVERSVLAGEGHLLLDLSMAQPVRVRGPGTDLRLAGRLVLDRQDTVAKVQGGFDALPGGRFTLFDNDFVVRTGRLTLQHGDLAARGGGADAAAAGVRLALRNPDAPEQAAPLEPVVRFTARGHTVDTHVLVDLRGPARRPELVLVSSPPLPEYQILTLLITGRVDAVDDRKGEVRRQVARLVQRFHNPSLSRQLYDRLGVDKLKLGFGSITHPVLTVGKQVTRQLFVETVYRHNADPDENEIEGHVEYRLDPRWTVDTVYGDAGEGSAGLYWGRWFGGPPPPAPPREWLEEIHPDDADDDADDADAAAPPGP